MGADPGKATSRASDAGQEAIGDGANVGRDVREGVGRDLGMVGLAVGSLGVVFGDLGTSPLYAIRETFLNRMHELDVDRANVLGVVSIVSWTLIVLIAIKYVLLVMRADNDGEGGILALTALVRPHEVGVEPNRVYRPASRPTRAGVLVLLGLFGTALLFGDGMITPAISVLSAVEGVKVFRPNLEHYVVPIAVVIIVALFAIQRFGTRAVGRVFGPVMFCWFAAIATLGAVSLARTPEILNALNPVNGVYYFANNSTTGLLSMGSIFLVVTGGEALYADMGHFGRRPISLSWFSVVLPSLLITYLGIGALLLRDPGSIESPLFRLAPAGLQPPLVLLATLATVIASQALISGVFSLTLQAVKLGYAPRVRIVSTSAQARGQIYVPMINWVLMLACVGLIIGFETSGRLAGAYGVAVTVTMFITTILFSVFAHREFGWNPLLVGLAAGVILLIEGAFLVANLFKIPEGGWFPIVIGAAVVTIFTTWRSGRSLVRERIRTGVPLPDFAAQLGQAADSTPQNVVRVDGTAVFFHSQHDVAPPSLVAHVRSSGALHRDVYVVSIETADSPTVPPAKRQEMVDLGNGVRQVTLHYGFMEQTPVADDLEAHLGIEPSSSDYFLGRESVRSTALPGMARWRERLFGLMVRNSSDVAVYFQLPDDRVVEIGQRVEL